MGACKAPDPPSNLMATGSGAHTRADGGGGGEPADDQPDGERPLEQSAGDGANERGAGDAEQLQQVARGEAGVAHEAPDSQEARNESGAEEQSAEEEASDTEPGLGDVVENGIRVDSGVAAEDDEAHDTDGQDDALEDPRAQVARSYGLVVRSQDRKHQDTDADHECRVEQHQRGAGDEQRRGAAGAAAVSRADAARRHEVADAICQEARKEEDPNDSGGPTHAGVRANDWRGGRIVGGGFPVQNGHGQSSSPHANATCCVGSGWCPAAASGALTTTTSHATPDTR